MSKKIKDVKTSIENDRNKNNEPYSEKFNESKEHYESLINLFKTSLTLASIVLGIVGTTVAIMTFSDRNQMRSQVKEAMETMEKDLKDKKTEFDEKIKFMKEEAKENLKEVEENAKLTLENTKENANTTFSNIKNESVTAALNASKNMVEQTFKDNNIKTLIEDVARTKMEGQVQSIIDRQLNQLSDKFSNSQNDMPIFMLNLDKIRWGETEGLYTLDSIYRYSKDITSKNIAHKIIIEKGRGYKSAAIAQKDFQDYFEHFKIEKDTSSNGKKKLILRLRNDILVNSPDLYEITYKTIWLSTLLNKHLDNFDLEAIRNITP